MSIKGQIMQWLHGSDGPPWGSSPSDFDPESVRRVLGRVSWLFGKGGYLAAEVAGWERLPREPVMIVSNHSGGTLIPDAWGWMFSWYAKQGLDRPLHPLAHDFIFSTEAMGRFFSRNGVVRAGHDRGYDVLKKWRRDLLVMPGGDRETWRPWTERYQVKFSGRKGYAKLALRAGVPVVPVAHAGAHETLMVLTDGSRVARALRIPQLFRAEVFPVSLSLPWGLTVGPWPHIPLPRKMRYRIAQPIVPPPLRGREPTQQQIDELDVRVRAALQGELNQLRDEAAGIPAPPIDLRAARERLALTRRATPEADALAM